MPSTEHPVAAPVALAGQGSRTVSLNRARRRRFSAVASFAVRRAQEFTYLEKFRSTSNGMAASCVCSDVNALRNKNGTATGAIASRRDVGVLNCESMVDVGLADRFDALYRREYPGLIAVAAALTGDRDSAQDLVHDTMVQALIRWDRVSQLERPGAWCHHVLVNACRSRLRRRATERRYMARLRRFEPSTPGPSPETVAFWTVVRTLPSRPRSVVALYFGADLTTVQIAEVLRVPEGTVRSDLVAARRVVMNALKGDGDE